VVARVRPHVPALLGALAGLLALAWLGLIGFAWTDYDGEAAPAFLALSQGHLVRFLELAPSYGGSLVLRAPFALIPSAWGGGELAVYRAQAVPCLLAAGALGVWLVARLRADGQPRLTRATALALCVASPIALRALEIGHAEEILGAVLCLSAVLAAGSGRRVAAGVLLGLAIATKAWGVLAIGPVLLALPAGRWRALLVAAVVAVLVLAPLYAGSHSRLVAAGKGASQTGTLFTPGHVWWYIGKPGVVMGSDGHVKPGYRVPPAWLGHVTHPLIVFLALPLTLLAVARRRRGLGDALLLLALLLHLRCLLDTWNNVYYCLPFLFALLGWETVARRRPPVLTLASTFALWALFTKLPGHVPPDAQAAIYLLFALPAAIALALALYAPGAGSALLARWAPAQGSTRGALRYRPDAALPKNA
jgi:hypothetical protein